MEINQLSAFNQLPESTPILEIPPIYLFFGNFQHLFDFQKIPVFFRFWKFPSFFPFSEIFIIFGHSTIFPFWDIPIKLFPSLGNSHHFFEIYLLFTGLNNPIWNFLIFFIIFLDPFGIFQQLKIWAFLSFFLFWAFPSFFGIFRNLIAIYPAY